MSRLIKTLEDIVRDVRYETGRSGDRNFGIDQYDTIKYIVQREQRRLWWDFDWKFLRVRRDLSLVAGQRYYDVPDGLSFERINQAQVKYSEDWLDLESGVGMDEYSIYDSDNDERYDPAMRWDIIDAESGPQIEIWPIPAAAQTVRFTGISGLDAFVADDDTCTLDATLLTFFSAAVVEPENQKLQAAANRLLQKQTSHLTRKTPNNKISMKGRDSEGGKIYQPKRIIAVNS